MLLFCSTYLLIGILIDLFMMKQLKNVEDISIPVAITGSIFFLIMLPYISLKIVFKLVYYYITN